MRRTDKGVVTQFAYRGLGDVPVAVYDGARNLVQQFVYLPGGVSVTLDATATSRTWSFPNLHGHVTATSNDNGDRLTSVVYDPWGVALYPVPNNVSGTADLGAYGGNGKLTESTTTKAVTHMGARPYTASTARFLTVDPIHGGCANHYVYGFGDPLNAQDLTGKGIFDWVGDKIDDAWGAAKKVGSWAWDHRCEILLTASIATGVGAVAASGALATALAAGSVITGIGAPLSVGNIEGAVGQAVGAAFFGYVGAMAKGAVQFATRAEPAIGPAMARWTGGAMAAVSTYDTLQTSGGLCS